MNETSKLCQCNQCDIVLIDKNPQTGAIEFELKFDEQEMIFIYENGGFWACPGCKDDGCLQDNITIRSYNF